ncbi:MAG TPA: response regulator, partial [Syntrophales bacterium]
MSEVLNVLCLEDSPRDAEIMRELLIDAEYNLNMDCTAVEKEFVSFLRSNKYDIILSDFKLPGFDGFTALRWSVEICPDVPFICISGTVGEETAVELLKKGAVDYILKDRLVRLPSAIQRALDEAKEKKAHKQAEVTLRESERKLREAQEMAHLGFWHWDVKTGDVEWSDEVFKIFHLDPKEFTPHIDSILELSPWPANHQRNQELISRAIKNHNPGSYEQKFLRPDGSIGYYYST